MFYSGTLHMHSTHSYDGKVPLVELKDLLVNEGVSFACMTEHTDELSPESAEAFVAECSALSDDRFMFVPGFEVPYNDAHILMIGCTEFRGAVAKDAQSLRDWASGASLVILAHPVRNRFIVDDAMLDVLDGVEIWNQQYEGKRVPRTRSYRLLEVLRDRKFPLIATGGLDLHRVEHLTQPRVSIELDALNSEYILDKLKAGAFTFGHARMQVSALGKWPEAKWFSTRYKSWISIGVITFGKTVNKVLATLGLSFPKGITRLIRSRV